MIKNVLLDLMEGGCRLVKGFDRASTEVECSECGDMVPVMELIGMAQNIGTEVELGGDVLVIKPEFVLSRKKILCKRCRVLEGLSE